MKSLENFTPKIKKDREKKSWFNLPAAVLISLGSMAVGALASEAFSNDHKTVEIINNNHGANCPCAPCNPHKPKPHVTTTTTVPEVTTTTEPHVTTTTIHQKPPVNTTTTTTIPFKPPVTTTTLPDLGSGYGYGN